MQICNAINIVLTLFVLGHREDQLFLLFLCIEVIYICDLIISFVLKKIDCIENFNEKKGKKRLSLILLTLAYRFPQVLFLSLLECELNLAFSDEITVLLLSLKLLGFIEFLAFIKSFKNQQMAIKINNLLLMKLFENLMIFAFAHHFFACTWLILDKYAPNQSFSS